MAEASHPYILEVEAIITSRTLIYASTLHEASEILEERLDELEANLRRDANLPKEGEPGSDHIITAFDVRPAVGYEVAGSAALIAGLTTLETNGMCSCDHSHEDD